MDMADPPHNGRYRARAATLPVTGHGSATTATADESAGQEHSM